MQKLDLEQIIEDYGLDREELAKRLFPTNIQYTRALSDLSKRVRGLRLDQLYVIADAAGVTPQELFQHTKWKALVSKDCFTFQRKNYRATLDKTTWEVKITHDGSLLVEYAMVNKLIPLSEFLDGVDAEIQKHKNQIKNQE